MLQECLLLLRGQKNDKFFNFITSLGQTKVFHSVPQRYWDLDGRFILDTRLLAAHSSCIAGISFSPPQSLPRGGKVGKGCLRGRGDNGKISSLPSISTRFLCFLPNSELSNYTDRVSRKRPPAVIQVLYRDYAQDKIFNNCIVFCLFVNSLSIIGVRILKT